MAVRNGNFEQNQKGGVLVLKTNMGHPNFFLGLMSYLLLLTGVVVLANESEVGKVFILASVLLGAIHWIGSLINVWNDRRLKNEEASRYFWFSLVIMIPPIAGMLYYMTD